MGKIVKLLAKYYPVYLSGLWGTLWISAVTVLLGLVLGMLVALMRMSRSKLLNAVSGVYIEVLRGTPILLQLYFFWIGLPKLVPFELSDTQCIVVALAVNASAFISEIIRAGIAAVDKGQWEAARSIGLSETHVMTHVILPQALRNIIPQIGNNFIINIKDTSVLSVISITDLFFVHKSVVGALYTYFESATIVMVIYLTMTLFASYLLRLWEKALDGPQNYDLNTTDSLAYTSGMYNAPDPNHESQNLDMKGGAAHV